MTINQEEKYINVTATCTAITAGAIQLDNTELKNCWFPLQFVSPTMPPVVGQTLTARVAEWIYTAKITEAKVNASISFSTQLKIDGYCTHITDLAYMVYCNQDGEIRPFAKSKIGKITTGGEKHEPITLIVPAWMVKRSNGNIPAWAAEVLA